MIWTLEREKGDVRRKEQMCVCWMLSVSSLPLDDDERKTQRCN